MATKNGFGLVGKHVRFRYRSGGGEGVVTGIVTQGRTRATTMFSIRPDAKYRHPGEPALIHRHGDKLSAAG